MTVPAPSGPSKRPRVAVVIPCYAVKAQIMDVIDEIPPMVSMILCVDDACPEGSGDFVDSRCRDPRVAVLHHSANQGVGGAMTTGYRAALQRGAEIVVKVDGDGQMDPRLIPRFVAPIVDGLADYTKGNRFYRPESVRAMPKMRLFGNAALSLMNKMSSGYWPIFDPTNGYTAIHAAALRLLPLDKISKGYFFESDMLFRLNTVRAAVLDVPMDAAYEDEASYLSIHTIIVPFLIGHLRNLTKRFFYNYVFRDFNIASLEFLVGLPLLIFGVAFGVSEWIESNRTGLTASAGTVMLSALPIIVGLQMILSALNYDMANVPRVAIHTTLGHVGPSDGEEERA